MISQNFVDDECICYKKFATHPPELVICPLHPCICLEAQNINCEYCESEIKRLNEEDDEEVEEVEEEEEEVEEVEKQQEQIHADTAVDLNCYEDFEAAAADPPQEIVLGNWKYRLTGPAQEPAVQPTKDETLEDYLSLQSIFEVRRSDSHSNVEDYDYLNLQITFGKRRDSI